jgi:hypothetical protein
MQLVSPLINYLTEKEMIRDTCAPVSEYVTTAQIDFTAAGTGLPTAIALNTPYYLKPYDLLNAKNSKIKALEVVSPTFQSIFSNGSTNVTSDDVFSNFTLNILNGEQDVLIQTPLTSLLGIAYGGYARKLYQTCLEDVVWSNCYIEITGNTALVNPGNAIKLNIYYDIKNDKS